MGTVICPLLLMVLDGGIFTSYLENKDSILYFLRQPDIISPKLLFRLLSIL